MPKLIYKILLIVSFFSFFTLAATYAMIKTANIKAGWRFEGNPNDWSGNSNNGTVFGATLTTGKFGQAYDFNGSSNYIQITNSATLSPGAGDFTISAWVKLTSLPASGSAMPIYNDYGSAINNDIELRFWNDAGTQKLQALYRDAEGDDATATWSGHTINVGEWHFIVGLRNGTTVRLYVDGAEKASTTNAALGTITVSDGSNAFLGTKDNPWNTYFLNGLIDEFRIYNRALTEAEVRMSMLGYEPGEY